MSAKTEWFAVGLVLASLSAVLGVATVLTSEDWIAPGSVAPDFRATNVATGAAVTLESYRGDVVLLNVWATWCRPCEEEMPSMQRLHEALGPDGLRVVAVSIDEGGSDKVLRWVRDRSLTFDVLHDPKGQIEHLYQTTGVPESFVMDRAGVIVKRQIGAFEWDGPTAQALVRRLLGIESGAPVVEAR